MEFRCVIKVVLVGLTEFQMDQAVSLMESVAWKFNEMLVVDEVLNCKYFIARWN